MTAVRVVGDLSRAENVNPFVDAVAAAAGAPIDILVNNAGATWGAPAEEHPLEGWNKVMDLNLTGVFLLTQQIGVRWMIPRRQGRIVNIASVAGIKGALPRASARHRLPHQQGRSRELHARARRRMGPVRHHRERHLPRLHPLEDVAGRARQDRSARHRGDAAAASSATRRTSRASSCCSRAAPRATSPGRSSPSTAAPR